MRIYKEVAKVDAKGLTKTDFRNLLFKTEPGDRRRCDTKFQDEVCGDMFRALDKDRDGYVMLEDLLKHFVPPAQLKRMPRDFIASVFSREKVVVQYAETPRLPEENKEELREVYDLWAAWAQESGNRDGKLDREALIDILAGRYHAEFSWMEAREAADRIFAELPSDVEAISFADFSNHLQDVLAVPYSEVS